MLTDTILENDNIIVTVPEYLDDGSSDDTSESLSGQNDEPVVVESTFDDSNILLELEDMKQIQLYNLSFSAGIFTFFLLYLVVKFFKIFF